LARPTGFSGKNLKTNSGTFQTFMVDTYLEKYDLIYKKPHWHWGSLLGIHQIDLWMKLEQQG